MIEVRNRELIIPKSEVYIGTAGDNNSENRLFRIPRYIPNGVDLAALSFRLDLENRNGQPNTAELEKEVIEEHIILKWNIIQNDVSVSGTLFVNIRATDYQGTVKWNSFKGAFYVEPVINTAEKYTGKLSEMEQMEFRIDEKTRILDANEDVRQTQEEARQKNTAAAIASANQARDKANTSAEKADKATNRATTAAEGVEAAINRANTAAANTEDSISRADSAAVAANNAAGSVNEAKTNANSAAKAANTAADSANAARDNANSAASGANTAKANADTAASNANAKATAANNAATAANTAKGNADKATAAANTAAANADTKASLANTAATGANNAASAANTSKVNADKATTAANTAASNANAKAGLANEKAVYAQTQGDYAKEQGDLAKDVVSGSGFVMASGGDISNTKISTADAVTVEFPVPEADDTARGFLGKMKKFCTDFNNFKAGIITLGKLVNNGACTEPGFALDARYGKTLADQLLTLNRDLGGVKTDLVKCWSEIKGIAVTANTRLDLHFDTTSLAGKTILAQHTNIIATNTTLPEVDYFYSWSDTGLVTVLSSQTDYLTIQYSILYKD